MGSQNLGYDIESFYPGKRGVFRFIEVKGRKAGKPNRHHHQKRNSDGHQQRRPVYSGVGGSGKWAGQTTPLRALSFPKRTDFGVTSVNYNPRICWSS
ncbi:MAG: DUF3883 domain-containing protein, partial [Chloroflexi bacterium]|nr:DUF3883 domain-containing protein [Chloroflexota bacterium]